ncbi:MAG: SH3 domain-containing protein [Oscillatoriophycideae cyanobacterium NC_groundwater_1537_Pr4_S-0.65um_50_18]|nr:SH3 domain-containing protein [Oscillatoriophycideae cyanobacterium NC_groundwater_1537_Pr4_S-0.65um_50_18]
MPNYIAIVKTQGDPLRVRATANGQPIDLLPNGTLVYVTGNPVSAGGLSWSQIGVNRWVATQFLAPHSASVGKAKVVATRTPDTLGGGLRVYKTELLDPNNQVIQTVRGISGRVGKQTPSHVAGSATPLPFGIYTFDLPGSVDESAAGEFGNAWSAVTPTFRTERSGLGIHYDPSALKQDANTGTAGCFATPTKAERDVMTKFIRAYKPLYFMVLPG